MDANTLIASLYRSHYSRMIASLASYFGLANLALAEDIVQDTFATAVTEWNKKLPDQPDAWLFKVCKNKAINTIDKGKRLSFSGSVETQKDLTQASYHLDQLFLDHEIKDNQLRLLFACCHPSLSPKSQVILILKHSCSLRTSEIARGLGMQEESVVKALNRSRKTLESDRISLAVPFLLRSRDRLNSVHLAIYLLFNEGYSASRGEEIIRKDLCFEAMRIVHALAAIPEICSSDTYALLALMSFHVARFDARTGTGGELIELERQDRNLWDDELIRLGVHYLNRAVSVTSPSRFQLEAAIASIHCRAKWFLDTDWGTIVQLYNRLHELQPSPFTDLNRAVATFYAEGAAAARAILTESPHLNWLKQYYLYHALLGKIAESEGKNTQAIAHYKNALSVTEMPPEQEFLKRKISAIED